MREREPIGLMGVFTSLIIVLSLISCHQKETPAFTKNDRRDSIPAPEVTVLADLPDSLRPLVTYLDKSPKPVTTQFTIPPPTEIFIDSMTGDNIPAIAQGIGFFKNYNTEQGLCYDMVHCIYRDRQDQLWFGTMGGGVARYDGETFTCFTTDHGLPSNVVWCIYEDRRGDMWFGTNDGLSRYDGRIFVNYTTETGLPGDDIGRMVEDDLGNLWITMLGYGLLRFDGKSFTNFTTEHGLTSNDIWNMIKDYEGRIWCSTRGGGGIFSFIPETDKTPVFSGFAPNEHWAEDLIVGMLAKNDGTMWFGTERHGAFYYDGKEFTQYTSANGLNCNTILAIKEDQQGNIWFGTCEGICRFDNETFVRFDAKQGLTNKMVNCMTDDAAGNLWIGTYGGGVFQYGGEAFVNFKSGPVTNNVTSILQDNVGQIWFGTRYRGISIYNGQTITTLTPDQGLTRNWINSLMEDSNGNIWFSPYYGGGVQRINNSSTAAGDLKPGQKASLTTFTTAHGLPFDAVNCIEEDENGNFWFATYGGGISRFDGNTFTTYTTAQGLKSNDVWALFEDKRGNLWVQYIFAEGISFFNGVSFLNITTDHGLADNSVYCITEDSESNLLFGTLKGISLLRKDVAVQISKDINYITLAQEPIFETFTANDGLPGNAIYDIVSDQDENLLISTDRGLAFLKRGLYAFSSPGQIEIFNASGGYPLRSPGMILRDKKGAFWISTDSDNTGLVRFDPEELHRNWDPPQVILQKIQIDNEPVNWFLLSSSAKSYPDSVVSRAAAAEDVKLFGRVLMDEMHDSVRLRFGDIRFDSVARWNAIPLNLVLPYQHNNITIDFHANVTNNNHLVKYQYVLEGYDNNWSPPSVKSFASFGNMHEGQYTFKVKAQSTEGIWSDPVAYSFRVLPPIHRTWWAYCLYGLMLTSLIYATHRFQKHRTIRKEREKANQKQAILNERLRISRELHDEVGATLSGIAMYSHLAKEQIERTDLPNVMHSLNVMQESSGEMVNKLSDIVWLLNPEQGDLQNLIEKLEDYGSRMGQIKGIRVHTSIPDSLSRMELPVEQRKHIYLICKEAINNAVKYSQATTIDLKINDYDHTLEFVVQDNGVGFDMENIRKGNGLENMQKRAEEMGASLELASGAQQGTRLRLGVKVTH